MKCGQNLIYSYKGHLILSKPLLETATVQVFTEVNLYDRKPLAKILFISTYFNNNTNIILTVQIFEIVVAWWTASE